MQKKTQKWQKQNTGQNQNVEKTQKLKYWKFACDKNKSK